MPRLLHGLFLFLAALWCGSLTFFAAAGARIVLTTSTTRHAGGTVNRALLDALDVSSYAAVALLAVLFVALDRRERWKKLSRGFAIRLLIVAAAATVVSHLLVTPEMMSLRDRMGAIMDLVPKDDPLRRDWGRLHGLSSLALLLRILCAGGLFAVGFSPVPEPKDVKYFDMETGSVSSN